MTHRGFLRAIRALAAASALVATGALADVDLTGDWLVSSALNASPVCADFVQSGTTLDVSLPLPSNESPRSEFAGTIDPSTGQFHVAGAAEICQCATPCGCTINGDASEDGMSFSATLVCTTVVEIIVNGHDRGKTCLTLPLPMEGVRTTCGERPICPGDCNRNHAVTADELITGVKILLNQRRVDDCPELDVDGDGAVVVSEVIQAVNAALIGCP